MILYKILGECPKCDERTFGNIFVRSSSVVQGCQNCGHRTTTQLPRLQRQVIYLDQFFLSNAMKNDKRFVPAVEKLRRLIHLQQVACPYSETHLMEAELWRQSDKLKAFIKNLCSYVELEPESEIFSAQLHAAFDAYQSGAAPGGYHDNQSHAFSSDIHDWMPTFSITTPDRLPSKDEIAAQKEQQVDGLMSLIEGYRTEHLTFKQAFLQEVDGARSAVFDLARKSLRSYMSIDPNEFLNAPAIGDGVLSLYRRLEGLSISERHSMIQAFIGSDHFSSIPCINVTAKLYAALRMRVQNGNFSNDEKARAAFKGLSFDVRFLSYYAPYCDVVFVDNMMGEWLTDRNVLFEREYNTLVFSTKILGYFCEFLDGLLANVPPDVEYAVEMVY